MAVDAKISELPAATTPLAGTEEQEIIQGGINKRVAVSFVGGGGGTVTSVTGTANRITSTGGATPVINIDAAYDAAIVAAAVAAVPDASETVKGIIEIATQGETDTGTDDLKAITPLKLAAHLDTDFFYVSSFRSLYNY